MTPVSERFEIGSTSQMLNDARAIKRSRSNLTVIPDNAVPFFADGSVATPAFGAANQVLICEYEIPIGWEGLLMGVMNYITGDAAGFINGSGDGFWTIDIDVPLLAPLISGHFLPGYAAILRTLGDLSEPWPVNRGWKMRTGEFYRYKFTNLQNIPVGSPCFVHASLCGLAWPNC